MKIAVWLPMQAWPDLTYERVRLLGEFARRAEELGFNGVWAYDHLVKGAGLYDVGWLEPMTVLAYVAAVTNRVQLGTAIIVLPTRHPVVLAKEIATLDYLCQGRFVLGIGAGWNPREYEVVGGHISQRGRRTDEAMEAIRLLLSGPNACFSGKYYNFEDVTIDPLPPKVPPIWYGGGSRMPEPGSTDRPTMHRQVLRRIARCDGWISRAAITPEAILQDWGEIRNYFQEIGRDIKTLTFSHCNFVHLVDAPTRAKALEKQEPLFRKLMGPHRSFEAMQKEYMLGTVEDILQRLKMLEAAGLQHVILGTVDYFPEQLDLWAKYILPHFQ